VAEVVAHQTAFFFERVAMGRMRPPLESTNQTPEGEGKRKEEGTTDNGNKKEKAQKCGEQRCNPTDESGGSVDRLTFGRAEGRKSKKARKRKN